MTKVKLDKYEEEILAFYEADEFVSVMTPERKEEIKKIAEHTFKKDKRINIRISNRDLVAIQKRALEKGMPYQTLVSSILHKYISGSLRDIMTDKVE